VENLPPSTIADLTAEEILYQETVGA